jgi:hypothetical protein
VTLSGKTKAWAERVGAGRIELSMTHSRELAQAVCASRMLEPLYTADEMKRGRGGPRRRRADGARRAAVARGGDARFPTRAVRRGLRQGRERRRRPDRGRRASQAGRRRTVEEAPSRGADVIIDALFGTGFHGEPREDAARKIEAINAAGRRWSRSTCPRAWTPRPARWPAPASTRR